MIAKKDCPFCQGTGVRMIQGSSLFGLLKKEIPAACENCDGTGQMVETPPCTFCDGQGLVGNEREICRSCNGTGHADSFGFIPLSRLHPGTLFDRRCDKCGEHTFEILTDIEKHKLTKTWEKEEELRQVEIIERVKVRCSACNHTYFIPIDAADTTWHQELTSEEMTILEDMGINLGFMYQKGLAR